MGARELDGAELFVRVAADVTIEDGITCWRMESGRYRFVLRATPDVLLESIRRSAACYNAYIGDTGGPALRLLQGGKKKRKH